MKRSGREIRVRRRLAANNRLANAAHLWAMAAVQRAPASKAKCAALRKRGHKHAKALRGAVDRLLGVVCKMLESGQTFDSERQSKASARNPNRTLEVRLRVLPASRCPMLDAGPKSAGNRQVKPEPEKPAGREHSTSARRAVAWAAPHHPEPIRRRACPADMPHPDRRQRQGLS